MMQSNYDKNPCTVVEGFEKEVFEGYGKITKEIERKCRNRKRTVITVECYPGVRIEEIVVPFREMLMPVEIFYSDHYSYSGERITRMVKRELTDDRVFGVMTCRTMEEFFDEDLLIEGKQKIEGIQEGVILVIGTGASLLTTGDILIYADLAEDSSWNGGLPTGLSRGFLPGWIICWTPIGRISLKWSRKWHSWRGSKRRFPGRSG